jgi:hypothetical protein
MLASELNSMDPMTTLKMNEYIALTGLGYVARTRIL